MVDSNVEKFENFSKHLNQIDISNSEKFDRAILTLSTAGLAFSIALIRFIFPLHDVQKSWVLVGSWICFGLSIVCTVVSFRTAIAAIRDAREYGYQYYITGDKGAQNQTSKFSGFTRRLNFMSALFFVAAISMTIAFASFNLKGQLNMNDDKPTEQSKFEKAIIPPPMIPTDNSKPTPVPDTPTDSPPSSAEES